MAEIIINNNNFEAEVVNSELPVVIDLWASWCAPCRMLAPAISQIADEYAGRVKVGKINVDDEPELAAKFGVRSIPLVVLIRDGRIAASSIGYKSKEELIEELGI